HAHDHRAVLLVGPALVAAADVDHVDQLPELLALFARELDRPELARLGLLDEADPHRAAADAERPLGAAWLGPHELERPPVHFAARILDGGVVLAAATGYAGGNAQGQCDRDPRGAHEDHSSRSRGRRQSDPG